MKGSRLGIVVIIAIAFAALYGLNRLSQRAQEGQELPLPEEEVAQSQTSKSQETEFVAGPSGQQLGDPKAKVRVVAVVPMGVACHMQTMQILQEIAKADPKRVRVEFYDMNSPQGQKELAKHGIHCATVLVNGKFEWKVKRNGKEQTVVCQRKPNEPQNMGRFQRARRTCRTDGNANAPLPQIGLHRQSICAEEANICR